MMRLVLANAILGTALVWAVLHDREPPADEPAPEPVVAAPVRAPATAPAMLPIVPVSVSVSVPVSVPVEPVGEDDAAAAAVAAASEEQPAVSRAERLAALDALAVELEIFALDRRR